MKKNTTEHNFITAFWSLYENKPIEKISVNQLCQTAGYNRSTFYNHFSDIYDLQSRAVDNVLPSAKEIPLARDNYLPFIQEDSLKAFLLSFFAKKNRYIELLFKRHDEYLLRQRFKKNIFTIIKGKVKGQATDLVKIEVILEYQISAVLGVISYWYQYEEPSRIQDLVDIVFKISSNGVLKILQRQLDNAREGGQENPLAD